MTPAWLFLARLDGMIARLNQANKAVEMEGQNTHLRNRSGKALIRRIQEQREALDITRGKVAANGQIPEHVWAKVSAFATVRLLDECLLYLQAARARRPDVEADLCEITDVLFEELAGKTRNSAWRSFSVFAAEDSFDILAGIVRLRYPLAGVWDLPIAIHEFGHFVSRELQHLQADGSALLSFVEYRKSVVLGQGRKLVSANDDSFEGEIFGPSRGIDVGTWMDEIFADVFATYASGPCFACSCLLYRFDPHRSQEEADGKHPSYAKRAYVILQTLLRRNSEDPGRGDLTTAIQLLDQSWNDACAAAGSSATVVAKEQRWLNDQVSILYGMLNNDARGLRFQDWQKAVAMASCPPENEDFSLIELLNAAWICRLKADSNPDQLNEKFVQLAQRKTINYGR